MNPRMSKKSATNSLRMPSYGDRGVILVTRRFRQIAQLLAARTAVVMEAKSRAGLIAPALTPPNEEPCNSAALARASHSRRIEAANGIVCHHIRSRGLD